MSPWIEHARFSLTLFGILTPTAAIPAYMSLTNGQNSFEKARVTRTTVLTVFTVLVAAAVGGDAILQLLGGSLDALRVGGGIGLLLMGLSKLSGTSDPRVKADAGRGRQRSTVGMVPLGIPLLAGPGAISTVIIHAQRDGGMRDLGASVASIMLVCGLLWLTLAMAPAISRRLGVNGLRVVDRLVGLLLATIAIELMATGMRALLPGLA